MLGFGRMIWFVLRRQSTTRLLSAANRTWKTQECIHDNAEWGLDRRGSEWLMTGWFNVTPWDAIPTSNHGHFQSENAKSHDGHSDHRQNDHSHHNTIISHAAQASLFTCFFSFILAGFGVRWLRNASQSQPLGVFDLFLVVPVIDSEYLYRILKDGFFKHQSHQMVNWWFDLVVWIPGIPESWKGLLLRLAPFSQINFSLDFLPSSEMKLLRLAPC